MRQLHPALVVVAALGATLLLVIATARWLQPSDEHAYWLAGQHLFIGQPVYDPTALPDTPYAFWYSPVFAQAMAPIAALLPSGVFSAAWTVLLLGCLLYLGRGRPLMALALVAFVPVAVELWFRNVHLVLAVLLVLALRGRSWLFAVGAAIKIAPGIGIAYLAARGQWRQAAIASAVGGLLLGASVLLGVDQWRDFLAVVAPRGSETLGLLPVPYLVRVAGSVALAVLAGRLAPRLGEPLLVVAVTLALPTLWMTGLSVLVAIVPLAWQPAARPAAGGVPALPAGPSLLSASAPGARR